MVQIPDHPAIRAIEQNGYPASLAGEARQVALCAAASLRRLAGEGRLETDTKTARELCGVLKDALAVERELRAEAAAAEVTVRFEGAAEQASG